MNSTVNKEIQFKALLDRNNILLLRICWIFANNDHYLFEELRQEILIALWKEYRRPEPNKFSISNEKILVSTIAWRAALKYQRGKRRRDALFTLSSHLVEQRSITIETVDIEFLQHIIGMLDDNQKRWLTYYFDKYSYDEIAELEHISNTTARKRMSRLIKKLKKIAQKLI